MKVYKNIVAILGSLQASKKRSKINKRQKIQQSKYLLQVLRMWHFADS